MTLLKPLRGIWALLIAFAAFVGLAQAQGAAPLSSDASAALTERYASNDGVRIHYVIAGEGPLVVLIHGFGDYSATWDHLIPVLKDRYRVAALDLRGYNLSDQPQDQAAYAMAHLVGDVAAVIAAEQRKTATLIGHDIGGLIAWEFAITEPEQVDDLVVLSMPHPALLAKYYSRDVRPSNPYAAFSKPRSEDKLTAETLAAWVGDPVLRTSYIAAFKRSSLKAMMDFFRANDVGVASAADEASAKSFNLSLMIIYGANDALIPPSAHDGAWRNASNDSALLVVPGAGHFVHQDAPEIVNQSIGAWLDLHSK